MFSLAQFELCPSPDSDPFARPRPYNPDSAYVEGDTDLVKSFAVARLTSKRRRQSRVFSKMERIWTWKWCLAQHTRPRRRSAAFGGLRGRNKTNNDLGWAASTIEFPRDIAKKDCQNTGQRERITAYHFSQIQNPCLSLRVADDQGYSRAAT